MSQGNVELVRRLVEAFNARDATAAAAVLCSDAEWRPAYTGGGAVEGAVYRGPDGFRSYLEELSDTWAEATGYVDELREVGDQVLLFGRMHVVGRTSGVQIEQPLAGRFSFRNDTIVLAQYYLDREQALEAVGLSE